MIHLGVAPARCLKWVQIGLLLALLSTTARPADPRPAFPLKAAPGTRYLVDQQDRPVLITGDTAWSLIAQLKEAEVDAYLDDRQQRGFNAIIVSLIEHKFSSDPPNSRAGLKPFDMPGDFSTPNREYFEWAHRVIGSAQRRGIAVWLAPAYLGAGGGDEGFFTEIVHGGKAKLEQYGRFIAERFRDLPNIVWMVGGDFTPPPETLWTVTDLAATLRETDSVHPLTVHLAPETEPERVVADPAWLTLNTVYSYKPDLTGPLLSMYQRDPRRPFVLIETTYEGEHKATPDIIRRQAYWAMLAGACGQFFGNNPIWHFDGPGLFPTPFSWQQALDSVGSKDMTRWAAFYNSLPWWRLMPEQDHAIVTDGYGSGTGTALTAHTADHKVVVTYVPFTGKVQRPLTVSTRRLRDNVRARWFSPNDGTYRQAEPEGTAESGMKRFRTPVSLNGTDNDWILLLEND